jgi:hypothetical protein
MTATDRKHQAECPFWLAASMKCGICNGGICIPLDDHAEAFCKTPHFLACMQYTLHSENHICLLEKVRNSEENRRKYLRIETSQDITLVKIFESGKIVSHFSSAAKTIDMSKGGVRMATKKPLAHDTMVHFSFDDPFPQALHQITGQVEWCNKQVDKPGYQAGVSFQGDHIVEAMGRYLGQQQR